MGLPPLSQGEYLNYKFGFDGDARINGKTHINTLTIGTPTLPTGYKLAVDGKIICEEVYVRISDEWPDYVFEEQYQLKPLNEVEKYIAKHKHLPNVPDAKSIEAEGISIGEMQKIQMQKIEELTLYLIELKNENEALKKQIQELVR